jgi:hypothetical protein
MLSCNRAWDIQLCLRRLLLNGGTVKRLAIAGLDHFSGAGTLSGIYTAAEEGQTSEPPLVTYTGTYEVHPDCTMPATDTDQNGDVSHYRGFTTPDGETISFVQTDLDMISQALSAGGTERR